MTIHNLTENVFVSMNGGNTTALVLPKKVVIVDAGHPVPSMVETRRKVEAVSGRKVEMVILTHFHSDHTGALPVFADCTILSSDLVLKNLKTANRKPPPGYELTFPNQSFHDQLNVSDGDIQLVVKQTGGHTDDSTYVYCPNYRVLATGDNLVVDVYPFGAKGSNADLWIQVLEEYLSCDATHFIPGHGPTAGKEKVREFRDYMVSVKTIMKELIAEGESREEVLKRAGEVKYSYTPRDPTNEAYYKRWKEQYLNSWYNTWKNSDKTRKSKR